MNLDPFYDKSWKRKKKIDNLLYALCAIALIVMAYHHCCGKPEPKLLPSHGFNNIDISVYGRWLKLSEHFRRAGNEYPEMSASAVIQTSVPNLMAAVAIKGEKNSPYTSKQGGYKKAHVGAYQVNERYHGYAGATPIDQALKAEGILENLVIENNGNLTAALNSYGGDKTKKVYAKNILEELHKLP